jgi:hypothetical protein
VYSHAYVPRASRSLAASGFGNLWALAGPGDMQLGCTGVFLALSGITLLALCGIDCEIVLRELRGVPLLALRGVTLLRSLGAVLLVRAETGAGLTEHDGAGPRALLGAERLAEDGARSDPLPDVATSEVEFARTPPRSAIPSPLRFSAEDGIRRPGTASIALRCLSPREACGLRGEMARPLLPPRRVMRGVDCGA